MIKITKDDYKKITCKRLKGSAKKKMLKQIDNFYNCDAYVKEPHPYKVGDKVFLKKGTLLHGTYKNLEGLEEISKNGPISSMFTEGRMSKYPNSVGLWSLKKDCYLDEYINFYSGGTLEYISTDSKRMKTCVIPYSDMKNIMNIIDANICFRWRMEQTKEARFMPSIVQDRIQIGIIFNASNKYIKPLLENDVLGDNFTDKELKYFVKPSFYHKFLEDKKHKDDFFTDREKAPLFGIPSSFIEGILVGRIYEEDKDTLKKIKLLLPDAYICNLDGKVILI